MPTELERPILHCIWSLGSGGAERQISYLAPELARLGWNVHVAFAYPGKYREGLESSPVVLHDLGATHRGDPALPFRLARLLRTLRPLMIQSWLPYMDVVAGVPALLSRTPWIISERSSSRAYPPSLLHSLRTFLGRRARLVIANSDEGVEYWRKVRGSGDAMIPNGIPLESIAAAERGGPENPAHGAVLFVGRLIATKNVGILISAMALPGMEGFRAVVCGAGPGRSRLVSQLRESGLEDRVVLAGHVEDIWPWMKAAGALVAPSLFEGNPNAVLEAAACGTPLVVSDIPAHRQILRDQSAFFVDPLDARSVAQGIRDAFSSATAALVSSAREDVARLDVTTMGQKYDRIYRTLGLGD